MLLGGVIGLANLQGNQARLESVYNDRVVPLSQLKRIADAYAVSVIDAINKANAGRISAEEARKELVQAQQTIQSAWKDCMATSLTEEETRFAKEARELFGPADRDIDRASRALERLSGKVPGQLGEFNGPLYDSVDPISAKIAELTELQLQVAGEAVRASSANYHATRFAMMALIAASTVLAMVCSVLITRSITRPMADAVQAVKAVAAGDLTVHVSARSSDETGVLMRALGDMVASLAGTVTRVRSSSDSVATASTQIATGNQDLSNRTEQQASALQETAATMDELGSTVRNNADNAKLADQLAQAAAGIATKGGEVVGDVVRTMHGITDSSRRIGEIIGVIDGIAFQTNILALNAAVEAARAGEQGRGFAVVASEVRALAQRSAGAAKEIKSLISGNVDQVEQGTTLVDRAGATMQEIVESIRRVSDSVAQISAATSQQSAGIQQIGLAVSQMDHVTQQNAALVEQGAAAAESLRHQARELVESVSIFRVQQGVAQPAAA